jgi:hypothetical protein
VRPYGASSNCSHGRLTSCMHGPSQQKLTCVKFFSFPQKMTALLIIVRMQTFNDNSIVGLLNILCSASGPLVALYVTKYRQRQIAQELMD